MKNIKFLFLSFLVLGIMNSSVAQRLLPVSNSFSAKKVAYIQTLEGSTIETVLTNIDRNNGLLKSLSFTNKSGEEITLWVSDIKSAYLPSLDRDMSGTAYDFMKNEANWDNKSMRMDLINDAYTYFEQSEVEMGGKSRKMLLQLLNPTFSNDIKIFMDPWASKLSIKTLKENNMNAVEKMSFYVKDGSFPALKLNKGQYKDNFIALFGECQKMLTKKEKASWNDFEKHVYEYSKCK